MRGAPSPARWIWSQSKFWVWNYPIRSLSSNACTSRLCGRQRCRPTRRHCRGRGALDVAVHEIRFSTMVCLTMRENPPLDIHRVGQVATTPTHRFLTAGLGCSGSEGSGAVMIGSGGGDDSCEVISAGTGFAVCACDGSSKELCGCGHLKGQVRARVVTSVHSVVDDAEVLFARVCHENCIN